MDRKRQLETQIENLRNRMYEINEDQHTEEEVIRISQKLDLLLNQYRNLTGNDRE